VKVRFQADADFNYDIVSGVLRRVPEIDFRTAEEADLKGLPDDEVLSIAAQDGRIFVSHDRRTMPLEFAKLIQQSTSPGLIIISQNANVAAAIEDLILIWAASEAEEYVNMIRELLF
jgi:hypothetical protein